MCYLLSQEMIDWADGEADPRRVDTSLSLAVSGDNGPIFYPSWMERLLLCILIGEHLD